MALTPERKAELHAEIDALLAQFEPPPPKPKPKPAVAVVASEGRVIRDAEVVVSPRDPNAENGKPRTVSVRAETVQINMAVAESQCLPSAPMRQIEGLSGGRISGSS
jgi:hypothetical protein